MAKRTIFQEHHIAEKQTLRNSRLLEALQEANHFEIDAKRNLIYMPSDPALARTIGISPHNGGPIRDYQDGIISRLRRLSQTSDGQLAILGDTDAIARIAPKVERLVDTMRVGLTNADLYTNAPIGMVVDEIRPGINAFFKDTPNYDRRLAFQIDAIPTLQRPELGWSSIVHSEQRVISTLQYVGQSSSNLIKGGDPEVGRNSLSQAIAQAHANGRLTLSDQGVLQVQNVLGEEAARPLRVPPGQRGFAAAELLVGDLSAGQALRTAGLLATVADTIVSGQRATHLLGQDNPLAAQSELAHFAGRNVGGWAGGTTAAYALGSSGAGPMVLIAADAYFMSVAGEKAAALLDNRAIYRQTDGDGTKWAFNGTAWAREGKADTTADGVDNPNATPIVASYQRARELNYQATNVAAALALKDAPAPQDPYQQPANATDRPSLSPADWKRDPADGQWHRLVKTEVSGANDRGSYVQETALPPRAAELEAQAQAVIARNIANSPGAIAARYELAYHRSGWAAEGLPMSPAVQQALPDPDALTASNGQRYYRNVDGQWTGHGAPPDANQLLELETTRAMLQPALAEQAQAIAAIQQTPPSPQDVQREQTLYQYRIVGTELQPQWREAIELATQRTREAKGLAGDGAMQLQRGPGGQYGADSPIAHLQRGADGVERIAAVTSTEDIRQALQELQARQQPDAPVQQLASASPSSEGSTDADTSGSPPSNQQALNVPAPDQATSAAQENQQRQQEGRQAQDQQLAQAHALQEQASREDRTQARQSLQAHAALEARQQALRLAQQERQAQDTQQREEEQEQRQAHDIEQHQQAQQQSEQQTRQALDAQHNEQQRLQLQEAPLAEQPPVQGQDAPGRKQAAERTTDPMAHASPTLHALGTAQREAEQRPAQDHDAHRPQIQTQPHAAQPEQAQPAEVARQMQHTADQLTQEERAHQSEQHAVIAQAPAANRHQAMETRDEQAVAPPAAARDATPATGADLPADARTAQLIEAPEMRSFAAPVVAERIDGERALTPQPPVPNAPAAPPTAALVTDAARQSHGAPTPEPPADHSEHAAPSNRPTSASDAQKQAPEQAKPANVAAADPNSWAEIARSARALRIQAEQDLDIENRIADARQARIARGEPPFTERELRDGYDPDGPSAMRRPPNTLAGTASQQGLFATPAQTDVEQDDRPPPKRKSITGDPDVDDLVYALDSKNDLAIEQALKRAGNSAHSAALAQQGHEHLDAKAQQEAQEQVTTRQALGMDVAPEVQTSRGPVMVLTLPQFANGPMMQGSGPPGDGGGGDGGGGGSGGGGGGG
ncbi:AHH domain-containing protein [Xanthomonas cucurbitae]|uniref:AHH domain-containing protein n=1 Tax=Xanthomonas cucurbitae TaxID=56453 RepID=UPI002368B2C9|nr:AHH domain-containing protein [Xanthomonas cucurbitae]WDM77057.1 AHH domain-containing protein [Xanthomonas cucurbitae]